MADQNSSANNSRYSGSAQGIPQFRNFAPLPAGQRTTVSSNPQRVTEDTLTQYMDEQSKNYDRSQRKIEALTASSPSRAQNTSSVPDFGAEGGEIRSDHIPYGQHYMENPSSSGNEAGRLTSFDINVRYHHAYSGGPGNVAGSTDLTTTGGGPSIDPPSYDQQKKE